MKSRSGAENGAKGAEQEREIKKKNDKSIRGVSVREVSSERATRTRGG